MTEAPEERQRLLVHGSTIEWTDSGGDGDVVLLVHAGVFAAWFTPLAADASLERLRVIRMVRAGYGSAPPPGPLSIADHATHCAALLDHLGVSDAHIVGHSSGAAIVLQLALERPDLVRSLVVSEPTLIDSLAAPEDRASLAEAVGPVIGGAIQAAASGDVGTAFDSFMTTICGGGYRDVLAAALGPDGVSRAERESAFFFTDEIMAVGGWPFDAASGARIAAPVLLVQGAKSPPPVHRLVAHVSSMLADATITTIDDDDHLLPLRSPGALGAAIVEHASRAANDRRLPAGAPDTAR